MLIGYNYQLVSAKGLCNDIESNSEKIDENLDRISLLMNAVMADFEEIKKIKPQSNKLHVQFVKLKEHTPKLYSMVSEQDELLSEKTSSIFLNLGRVLVSMESSAEALKEIFIDSDALIYKENKRLDKFVSKISTMNDSVLRHKVLNKIYATKEDLISVAIRLLELAKSGQTDLFNKTQESAIKRKAVSEQMTSLGIKVIDIGKVLEHLKIDDIDEISKKSEDQLRYLEKIELRASSVLQKLETYLLDIESKLYLLEGDVSEKIRRRILQTEQEIDSSKKEIIDNAERLLKDIRISS